MDTITNIQKLRTVLEGLSSEELKDTKMMGFYVAIFFKIGKAQNEKDIESSAREENVDPLGSILDGFDNPDKILLQIEECKNDITDRENLLRCAEILNENYVEEGVLKDFLQKITPKLKDTLENATQRLDILEHQYRFCKDPKAVVDEQIAESKRIEEDYKRTHPNSSRSNSGCMLVVFFLIISSLLLI